MNLNELSRKAHLNAVKHGFWGEELNDEHCIMLVITEVSEMVEAHRKNRRAGITAKILVKQDTDKGQPFEDVFKSRIKETLEDEMADIAIRLFDLAGKKGIDFERLTPCKYYRSFKSFTFTENAFGLCKGLTRENISIVKRIQFGVEYVRNWAKALDVDLAWHVAMKMRYNESRPFKHGKKY